VVNAAGLWSPAVARLAGVDLPIIIGRHPVFVVERDASFGRPHLVYLDLAGGSYARPETGGLTLTGSLTEDETRHPMEPELLGGDVSLDEATEVLERTGRAIPRLAEARYRRGWAGAFDITPDWMPILDESPVRGFWIAAGMSGPGLEAASGPPLLGDPLLYAVALIASAVCAPVFRYVLWLGDEGVLLHGAARILGGEVLYRDFFEVLPPGSFLIITAWMKLFGAGFASVRVLAVGVIAVIAALLYATARLSSDNRPLAALLSIAWAVRVPWGNSHHWFTTAASMAAAVGLLLALDGAPRPGAAFFAGLFAGAAAMVTPMRGALLCLAVIALLFTLPGARSRLLSAIVGIGLV